MTSLSTAIPTNVGYDPLYQPSGFVMIRCPLLPISMIGSALNSIEPLTAIVEQMYDDPVIQEALLVGSPDLFDAMSRRRELSVGKSGRQATAAFLRYLVRMCTRPTPFGLFAGVALGQIGPAMDVRIGDRRRHRTRSRPDMQWLLSLVRELERRPQVASQLRFFANPVRFIAGDRLYLPYVDTYGQADAEDSASLRMTTAVQRVLDLAEDGIPFTSLVSQLRAEWPGATTRQVESFLGELCHQGLLLSNLRPCLTRATPAEDLLDQLTTLHGCDDIRQQLTTVVHLLEEYDSRPIGRGIETLQQFYQLTRKSAETNSISTTLVVDMATTLERSTLHEAVAHELAMAGECLLRTAPYSLAYNHLETYRLDFLKRYGEGREVPLLQVLDSEIGIGPPAGYQYPHGPREHLPPQRLSARDNTLIVLAAEAIRNHHCEVTLDDALLHQLEVQDTWREALPTSFELYAFVAAKSEAAVAEGDFRVIIAPRVGDRPAGKTFGRFADLLGDVAHKNLIELAHREEARYSNRIFAELVYLPLHGHAANLVVRPALYDYEIVVAASPGVDQSHTIPMDDLVIGVRGNRFYVRSRSLSREVVVRDTHLLNYYRAPNACRFLAEVAHHGVLPILPFDWGAATQMPFLPRLRVGRCVLAPAQWQLPCAILGQEYQPRHGHQNTTEEFSAWRERWNLPRFVYLTMADNRLLLDLDDPSCMAELERECRKHPPDGSALTLQEMLPGFDDLWATSDDERFLVEFVVPFERQGTVEPAPTEAWTRRAIDSTEYLRQPGSDWLYVSLYASRLRHDDLLAGPIRELITQVTAQGDAERWFFIRYADPEPHLRLRFHGEPTRLVSRVLPQLLAWNAHLAARGMTQRLTVDAYDREIERYGGSDGLRCAEQIFAADSHAVIDITTLRVTGNLALGRTDLAVLTVDRLVSSLGIDLEGRRELYQMMWQVQAKGFAERIPPLRKRFHKSRKTMQRILGDYEWLANQPGGQLLDGILQRRAAAIGNTGAELQQLAGRGDLWTPLPHFLASCVHMHCNRLLGLDRRHEFEVMYYLARTLESLERYTPDGIQIA